MRRLVSVTFLATAVGAGNRGSQPGSVSVNIELQGNNHRKFGPEGPFRITGASTRDQRTINPFGGSPTGTMLRVTLTACTPTI